MELPKSFSMDSVPQAHRQVHNSRAGRFDWRGHEIFDYHGPEDEEEEITGRFRGMTESEFFGGDVGDK